jgi:hypothetical protein
VSKHKRPPRAGEPLESVLGHRCTDELLEDTMAHHSTFPRSHLLILGPNSIKSLLPVTPISQAEALLESHRIEDVILLADQQRKKVQGKLVADANEVYLSFWPPVSISS